MIMIFFCDKIVCVSGVRSVIGSELVMKCGSWMLKFIVGRFGIVLGVMLDVVN